MRRTNHPTTSTQNRTAPVPIRSRPAPLLPPDAAPPSPARRTTFPSPLPPQIRPQPRRLTALPALTYPPDGATDTGAASSSLPSTAIFSSQFYSDLYCSCLPHVT